MPFADERYKPMQGLVGFAAQTQMNADKSKAFIYYLLTYNYPLSFLSAFICVYLRLNNLRLNKNASVLVIQP
jgi:hypothetical protein